MSTNKNADEPMRVPLKETRDEKGLLGEEEGEDDTAAKKEDANNNDNESSTPTTDDPNFLENYFMEKYLEKWMAQQEDEPIGCPPANMDFLTFDPEEKHLAALIPTYSHLSNKFDNGNRVLVFPGNCIVFFCTEEQTQEHVDLEQDLLDFTFRETEMARVEMDCTTTSGERYDLVFLAETYHEMKLAFGQFFETLLSLGAKKLGSEAMESFDESSVFEPLPTILLSPEIIEKAGKMHADCRLQFQRFDLTPEQFDAMIMSGGDYELNRCTFEGQRISRVIVGNWIKVAEIFN